MLHSKFGLTVQSIKQHSFLCSTMFVPLRVKDLTFLNQDLLNIEFPRNIPLYFARNCSYQMFDASSRSFLGMSNDSPKYLFHIQEFSTCPAPSDFSLLTTYHLRVCIWDHKNMCYAVTLFGMYICQLKDITSIIPNNEGN